METKSGPATCERPGPVAAGRANSRPRKEPTEHQSAAPATVPLSSAPTNGGTVDLRDDAYTWIVKADAVSPDTVVRHIKSRYADEFTRSMVAQARREDQDEEGTA